MKERHKPLLTAVVPLSYHFFYKRNHTMRKLFTLLLLFATYVIGNAAVDPKLQAEAQRIADMLQSGEWTFVPSEANFPRTITFRELAPELNFFRAKADHISVMLDYNRAKVTHSLSDIQIETLMRENPEVARMIDVVPNFYQMEGSILKSEVKVSKNAKHVTLKLKYVIKSSNFTDSNAQPIITLMVDTRTGAATLNCQRMHYNESYVGKLAVPEGETK